MQIIPRSRYNNRSVIDIEPINDIVDVINVYLDGIGNTVSYVEKTINQREEIQAHAGEVDLVKLKDLYERTGDSSVLNRCPNGKFADVSGLPRNHAEASRLVSRLSSQRTEQNISAGAETETKSEPKIEEKNGGNNT